MKIVKQIFAFGWGSIIGAALSFISIPLVARSYSVADFGRYSFYNLIVSLGVPILSLEMHQAYVREYYEEQNKINLLKTAMMPGFVLITVAAVVLIFYINNISFFLFDVNSKSIGFMVLISAFLSFINNMLNHVVRMNGGGKLYSISQVLPKLFFIIVLWLFNKIIVHPEIFHLVFAGLSSILVTTVILVVGTQKTLRQLPFQRIDPALMQRMIKFSIALVPGGLAIWCLSGASRFLLRFFSDYEELGVFSAGLSLASVAAILSNTFSNIWHPLALEWISEKKDFKYFQNLLDKIFIGVMLAWCTFGLASPLLVKIFPSKYISAEHVVTACLAGQMIAMLSEITVIGIGVSRKTFYSTLASVSGLMLNLILGVFLVPKFGSKGAASTYLVGNLIFFIVRTEFSSSLWKKFERRKIYIVTSLSVFLNIVVMLIVFRPYQRSIVWLCLALLTIYFFRDQTLELIGETVVLIRRVKNKMMLI